jgi:hypothetical protein
MPDQIFKQKISKAKKMREEFKSLYSDYTNSLTKEINDLLKEESITTFPNVDIVFVINQYNCAFMEYEPSISLYYQGRLIYDRSLLEDLVDISMVRKIEKFSNNALAKYNVPVYVFHKKEIQYKKTEDLFDIAECLKSYDK